MATQAISFGVEIWLADLARSGWELTVSERLSPVLSIDGSFESMKSAQERQVGVLASCVRDGHEGVGHFVPCASEREAWRLLERVEAENQQ